VFTFLITWLTGWIATSLGVATWIVLASQYRVKVRDIRLILEIENLNTLQSEFHYPTWLVSLIVFGVVFSRSYLWPRDLYNMTRKGR
jgi:hypothetical protein